MQEAWFNSIDSDKEILVPTRSLATELNHQIAEFHIQKNRLAWQTPAIHTWIDFLERVFDDNRLALKQIRDFNQNDAEPICVSGAMINAQQSALLWTKVIEETRRQESELALLNVQQTVKAVMRSWKLLHEWRISLDELRSSHISDAVQFADWCVQYQRLLDNRNLIDEPLMLDALCRLADKGSLSHSAQSLDIYAFDLISLNQRRLLDCLSRQGLRIKFRELDDRRIAATEYLTFQDQRSELRAALSNAREHLESEPESRINIVVADLQKSRPLVEELAAEVFYPDRPPIELQSNDLVYRFSLGKPLLLWPAMSAANSILKLLRGRIKVAELQRNLRSRFARQCRDHEIAIEQFISWLQKNRHSYLQMNELPILAKAWVAQIGEESRFELFLEWIAAIEQQFTAVQSSLQRAEQARGYRALTFVQWRQHFSEWLECWGWSTSTDSDVYSSTQFQLAEKWHDILSDFISLGMVQQHAGLSTAQDTIHRMLQDTVFLPKSEQSPILISGLFEAIGRPANLTWITGMDDRFPVIANKDPFLGHHLRQVSDYPSASTLAQVEQAARVVESLMLYGETNIVSYAIADEEDATVQREASAIFRDCDFRYEAIELVADIDDAPLEDYLDLVGPVVEDASRLKGGTKLFEDQSNCAFRAFVSHRLGFAEEEDIEFGLDHLDRGNIVHFLLDRIWQKIGSQDHLHALINDDSLGGLVRDVIAQLIEDLLASDVPSKTIFSNPEKRALLEIEAERLYALAIEWLSLEAKRPLGFSVIESEEPRRAEIGGIGFRYAIDRVDILDDHRSLIIDYKTGANQRKDWKGPRVRKPQLPLYVLALEKLKNTAPSGIAVGQVKRYDAKFEELAEAGMFQRSKHWAGRYEQDWQEALSFWPSYFEAIAKAFIAGQAQVNPIDEQSCKYCSLQAVCRISQLRIQSGQYIVQENALRGDEF